MKNSLTAYKFVLASLACVLALAPTQMQGALIDGSVLEITGNANVGAAFLNWNCNAPGGPSTCPANGSASTGDFGVSGSTNTFAQYNGTFGFITDLSQTTAPLNTPFSIPNFITFVLNTNETIQLTFISLGTDTPSATCTGLTNCTPIVGDGLITPNNPMGLSAFNLDENAQGTAATFGLAGVIHDSSGASAPITGTFSAEFDGENPAQVLAAFAAAGTTGLNSTYSANMKFTVTPEPLTLSLMGVGLLGLGLLGRRRLQK